MADEPKTENNPNAIAKAVSAVSKLRTKMVIPGAIIVSALILGGAYIYLNSNKAKSATKCPGEIIPSQTAADKAIKYINDVLLKGAGQASLKSVTEEGCLYKVKINIQDKDFDTYITMNGKTFFPEALPIAEAAANQTAVAAGETIGGFSIAQNEICKENDKPIVYFFGSNSCPHCQWEHPIFEAVAKKFEGLISFHNNMDSSADQEVFNKYSDGGIPTTVFGCKYYRVGSGESSGEAEETKVLTAFFCKLTDNKPTAACDAVKDLVSQISD